ncbi:MAG: 3-deoxy-7-phosphoheptulonate synthase [Pseudanabaenaceae cyanobacterium bins.68]|nr:3-deoxy-7-phosphoheptulonate synthase [Pseudanabaenaceae cyanobacterium bins.68]
MIVVLKSGTDSQEIDRICDQLKTWGLSPEKIIGTHKVVLGLVGETAELNPDRLSEISEAIEQVLRVEQPYKRASRQYRNYQSSTVIVPTPNGDIPIGEGHPLVVTAGPCSVESEEMIIETALQVKAAGAQFLRGGAYKPRTSPYSFQGHGESALGLLAAARAASGLGIITEVMDTPDIDKVAGVADVLQVGARNMQNFSLLKQIGKQPKPVLLKRGMAATIEDWLMAAEYILAAGNPKVILCERGIRGFDRQYTRNTLDLAAIPVLRKLTHLPIMVDPSHGTGYAEYVPTMSLAAIAAGTDALMIEVHPRPKQALSDGGQCLDFAQFHALMPKLQGMAQTIANF